MKYFHHLHDNNKIISKTLYFFVTFFYIFQCFKLNNYEIIFIDERLLIDDIYNIWLLDDTFGRFSNVDNKFLKNLLIFAAEASYGGDLRYGRLWSNIFTFFIGPLSFFSDEIVITSSRLLNLFLLNLTFYIFSKTFITKKYFWLSMLAFLSLPGIEVLIRIPKPEVLSLLFVALGLQNYKNDKEIKSIFFLLIASFLKINFLVIFLFISFKIFTVSRNKVSFIFKNIGLTFLALVLVNPILIIPPIKIFDFQLPNFYLSYYRWIFSQGTYGQDEVFSFLFFQNWLQDITLFYLIPKQLDLLGSILIVSLIIFTSVKFYRNDHTYSKLFLVIFLFYIIFYMFFIERQFLWYITTPFIFLTLIVFMDYESNSKNIKVSTLIFLLGLVIGNISNISEHYNNKVFIANYKLGYEEINTEEQALELVGEVLFRIKSIYQQEKLLDKNKVLWNPNLFIPRNEVTYIDHFYTREYWGPDDLNIILSEADVYVTNEDLPSLSFNKVNVKNYYLFYK